MMLQNEYRREMEGLGPGPEELERLYELIDNVEGGKQVKHVKRLGRSAVAAIVVCAALLISAAAAGPTMWDIVQARMGPFAPYASELEGVTAVDQDIQVRVVSALADGSGGVAYLEITDLTGERFDESIPGISYDPETHTVLKEVSFDLDWGGHEDWIIGPMGDTLAEDGTYTLTLRTIYTSEVNYLYDMYLPDGILTDRVLDSRENEKGETVLVPNQTPAGIEGAEGFSLSSLGFDKDGVLHIQFAIQEGYEDYAQTGLIFCQVTGIDGGCTQRILEDGAYVDLAYTALDAATASSVELGEITASYRKTPDIEGKWVLTFPVEILPERTVHMEERCSGMPGVVLDEFVFSLKGVYMTGRTEGIPEGGNINMFEKWLYLADGTALPLKNLSGSGAWSFTGYDGNGGALGSFDGKFGLDQPVDPETVIGISIGKWYIPIHGETGGPGYWISELPEQSN